MSFTNILAGVTWLLLTERYISYRRIKREFNLDDDALQDLRHELIRVKCVATDRDGQFMVWTGDSRRSPESQLDELPPLPALAPKHSQPSQDVIPTQDIGSSAPAADTVRSLAVPTIVGSSDAERRPLTVMFCDLADSTILSTKLDPEDLQDLIRAYQERCTTIIREYEGFVARYMGDGILVYFGYPQSLERNAERAVRSALAIVESIIGLNAELARTDGVELTVRIGIATGMVVVGEIVGEGLAQERTVIGEAPNVAARMQGIADRNGIVLGTLSKEVAGDAFVYESLGRHELKGIAGLVEVWAVVGLKDNEVQESEHNETKDSRILPPLVGRDEEIGLLRRAWHSSKGEGRGQVVTLSGEAGIGKSALVDGLMAEVRGEGLPRVTFRCSPYHSSSALYPLIEHFKQLAGWQPGDAAEARLAKLETMLGDYQQPLDEAVPLLSSLASLPLPEDRYPPITLSPQQQKQQTQDTIIAMSLEAAERQPFLQVWEDLHWADPSTLELLGLLIEQVPTVPLMMVLTTRPDFVPPWTAKSHLTPITLNRLERPHTEALIARIAGGKELPAEVVDHIVVKTDGVPLYTEELTKTILASGILHDLDDRFELTGPLSSLSIPETLQESLMARLDRLPQVREIVQMGAVLGREFAYEMISGLSALSDAVLQEGLGQLVNAELLYQRGRPPRAKYFFKHALVQDSAYQSLLKRARQGYHHEFAQLLEARYPESVEAEPELLAHHYTASAEPAKAYTFWKIAAQRALKASAMVEAVSHLESALEVLTEFPQDRVRDEHELEVQTLLAPAKLAIKGFAFPPLEGTYDRALELCVQLDKPVERIIVMRGLQVFHMVGGRLTQSLKLAKQIAGLCEELDDPAFRVVAAHVVGQTNFFCGNWPAALRALDKGIEIYDPDKHQIPNWPGGSSGEQCHLYRAFILWIQGYPEKAFQNCAAAVAFSNRHANKFSLANTLAFVALIHAMDRNMNQTRDLAERCVVLCEEQSNSFYLHFSKTLRGWTYLETGGADDSGEEMKHAILASRKTGARIFIPYFLVLQAEGLAKVGKLEESLRAVDEALSMIEHSGEHCWEADVHRVKGDLILATSGAVSDAERSYLEAIRIAQAQGARSWELRAAINLARLWRDEDKPQDAHRLLTTTYASFEEGFDTFDLLNAKTLLDELSSLQVA